MLENLLEEFPADFGLPSNSANPRIASLYGAMRQAAHKSRNKARSLLNTSASNGQAKPDAPLPLAVRQAKAAELLSVSDKTLSTWTKHGLVPHIRIDGTILYPVEALKQWLHDRCVWPPKPASGEASTTASVDQPPRSLVEDPAE